MASGGSSGSSTIMLCVIISLVLIVLFYLMAGWIASYRVRRQAAAMQVRSMSGETSLPIKQQGLDPSIMAALPVFVYSETGNAMRECPVCLSSIEEEEKAILLPNCKHIFHAQCINMWLHSHTSCPICRCGVAPDQEAMPETIIEVAMPQTIIELSVAPLMVTSGSKEAAESSKVEGLRLPLSSCCTQPCGQTDHEPEDLERQR